MTTQAIYNALRAHLNDMANLPPVAYENQPYTPTTGTLWIRENLLPADTSPLTLADGDSMQYGGIYQVTVFAPADGGAFTGRTMAERIALHFKRGTTIITAGSGRVLSVSVGPSSTDNGWHQIPVSVTYRAYING